MGKSTVSCRFSPTNQSIDPWDKLNMRSNSSKISLGSSPEASWRRHLPSLTQNLRSLKCGAQARGPGFPGFPPEKWLVHFKWVFFKHHGLPWLILAGFFKRLDLKGSLKQERLSRLSDTITSQGGRQMVRVPHGTAAVCFRSVLGPTKCCVWEGHLLM